MRKFDFYGSAADERGVVRWYNLAGKLWLRGIARILEYTTKLNRQSLNLSRITAPLGKIAATRSQGVKDLRHGPGAPRRDPAHDHIAFRFLGASLAEDAAHPPGKFVGDGLVTLDSATAHVIEGDVQSVSIGKLGHLQLLTDARVYRQISEWIAGLDDHQQLTTR